MLLHGVRPTAFCGLNELLSVAFSNVSACCKIFGCVQLRFDFPREISNDLALWFANCWIDPGSKWQQLNHYFVAKLKVFSRRGGEAGGAEVPWGAFWLWDANRESHFEHHWTSITSVPLP